MANELELKAVVDDPVALRRRLVAAGATPGFRGTMQDRRYDRGGALSGRDEVLRVRALRAEDDAIEWHLGWKGPTRRSPEGYKLREEHECTVTGDNSPAAVLRALGYTEVHAIDRTVEVHALAGATVRIETYPRMDTLIEVEGDAAGIERAITATGLPRDAFSADSLADFVDRYERRTGVRALIAGPAPT